MRVAPKPNRRSCSVRLCDASVFRWLISSRRISPHRQRGPQSLIGIILKREFPKLLALVATATVFGVFCLSAPSLAKEAQPNEDPKIEQRMKALTEQLRCLVCQNETLSDSRADLAEDLRKQIREQIRAGKSDQEILAFLTQRYGDFVLYKPPVKKTTYLLWFGPFVLLIAGTFVLYRYLRARREMIKEVPLTIDERKRAEEILRNA